VQGGSLDTIIIALIQIVVRWRAWHSSLILCHPEDMDLNHLQIGNYPGIQISELVQTPVFDHASMAIEGNTLTYIEPPT